MEDSWWGGVGAVLGTEKKKRSLPSPSSPRYTLGWSKEEFAPRRQRDGKRDGLRGGVRPEATTTGSCIII